MFHLPPYLLAMTLAEVMGQFSKFLVEITPQGFKRGESTHLTSAESITLLHSLMSCVRSRHLRTGHYAGAEMNLLRTWQFAKMSGDFNPVHLHYSAASQIAGYQLMAHGMDAVIQAVAALVLYVEGVQALKYLRVEFRRPVILGEDVLIFEVKEEKNDLTDWLVEVYALSYARGKRLVAKVYADLRPGKPGELEEQLLTACHFSAAIAEYEPGCGYYSQQITYPLVPKGSARGNERVTRITGVGRRGDRQSLQTMMLAPGRGVPMAHGIAIIIV